MRPKKRSSLLRCVTLQANSKTICREKQSDRAAFSLPKREDKRRQFDLLREFMGRNEVSEVINACDAGREGFENLHPGSEYDALYEAALCRSRADWLVGINATRLFSVLYHSLPP